VKVSCLQENLARGLSIVGRAVAAHSTLPVLSNILLATDENRLKLAATNLEIGINCWIGARVDEDGAVTIPARLLSDFVNSLPQDRVDMEFSVRTQQILLRCARFEAKIKTIDAQEFPLLPTATEDNHIKIAADVLKRNIDQVSFAAATDESRPVLTGVSTRFDGTTLTLAAADGFRLAVTHAELQTPVDKPFTVIIPARAMAEVARIIGDQEEPVQITITPARNQVLFHMASVDLVSQLIEGNFPDYNMIVPKTRNTRTLVDTRSLLQAAKTANIFARDAANIVRLIATPGDDVTPGKMTLQATAAEMGENIGEVDVQMDGQPIEIAFNARYLIDVLSVITSSQVAMETTATMSPGVFKPVDHDDFLCVIMPMHFAK
jgi:DNA polymerase III subunit beta